MTEKFPTEAEATALVIEATDGAFAEFTAELNRFGAPVDISGMPIKAAIAFGVTAGLALCQRLDREGRLAS